MARPLGGYFRLVYLSFPFIVSILVVIRSLRSLGRSNPPLYRLIIKAPWDRGSPSSARPAPHRMLHERRFFFLASKAIVFTLSCVYGRSLFTVYLTNVTNPTPTTFNRPHRVCSSCAECFNDFGVCVYACGRVCASFRLFVVSMTDRFSSLVISVSSACLVCRSG